MIIIDKQKVYRIPEDIFRTIQNGSEYHDLIKDLMPTFDDYRNSIIDDCLNENELTVRFRNAMTQGGPLSDSIMEVTHIIWDLVVRDNDVSKWIVDLDLKNIADFVHDEPGSAFDFDHNHTISCAECERVGKDYLAGIHKLKSLLQHDKPLDEAALLQAVAALPSSFPVRVMIVGEDGEIEELNLHELQSTASGEWDTDTHKPTHKAPLRLN